MYSSQRADGPCSGDLAFCFSLIWSVVEIVPGDASQLLSILEEEEKERRKMKRGYSFAERVFNEGLLRTSIVLANVFDS